MRREVAKGLQYFIPSHHFTPSFLCGFAPFALCVSSSFQMSPDHQNVDRQGIVAFTGLSRPILRAQKRQKKHHFLHFCLD
jgi:hypothetical protein